MLVPGHIAVIAGDELSSENRPASITYRVPFATSAVFHAPSTLSVATNSRGCRFSHSAVMASANFAAFAEIDSNVMPSEMGSTVLNAVDANCTQTSFLVFMGLPGILE